MTGTEQHLDGYELILRNAAERARRAHDRVTAAQADYDAARVSGFALQAEYQRIKYTTGSAPVATPELRHYWAVRSKRQRSRGVLQRATWRLGLAGAAYAAARAESVARAQAVAREVGPLPVVPTPGA